MKTLFLYAPDRCLPSIPYSSLAGLQACLRRAGHETGILDLNVELFDHLIQAERLETFCAYVAERFAELEQKDVLTAAEHGKYRFYAPLVAAPAESLKRAVDGVRIMRDAQRFFDPEQFNQAFDDLTTVIRFVYAATPVLNPENARFYVEHLLHYSEHAGDPLAHFYEEELVDRILAAKPDLLAFTVPFHTQLLEVLKILRIVRRRAPEVQAVVGGPTISDYRDTLFADGRLFDWFDYAVMGDGENALVELAGAIRGEKPLEEVPNLYFRDAGGAVRRNAKVDLPVLDHLPAPDFDGVPFDRYLLPERLANFQTSRGCYYGRCTFCGDGFRRNFRMRHPDLVYEDVRQVAEKWGVKYFLFWDSLAPPRTLLRVAKRIAEEGLDVHWFAETKFEYIYANPKTVQALYDGGARAFQFGFESAVDRVLRLIDKGNELEKVDSCLETLSAAGVGVCTSWFIGFPTEREHEALTTYDYVSARRDRIVLSVYSGIFNLGYDTLVYRYPERFNCRIVETEEGDIHADDGLPFWDRQALNECLEQRGDLALLCHGGYLPYQTHHPERLREISAKGRSGLMAREIADLASCVPIRPARNRIARFRFEPWRAPQGESAEPVAGGVQVAFVGFHGMYHRVDADQACIFEACDGVRTAAELAAQAQCDRKGALAKIAWMIDRGIIVVPAALPEYRGLKRLAAV
ncbi:MAG: cobalamin B12-binding domain-containing protein [Planctomycetes bacterium]|nr:cobalamin B12-binding domain-containing protein [Planctomycetota bacterium]